MDTEQSSKGQLLEAKDNLQRMLAGIPLTDDERAAVDDGHSAVDALLARLVDVPTPAGPTPHQIGIPPGSHRPSRSSPSSKSHSATPLSLIHISEPTRLLSISYAVF